MWLFVDGRCKRIDIIFLRWLELKLKSKWNLGRFDENYCCIFIKEIKGGKKIGYLLREKFVCWVFL